jgi:hypothetical protein
VTVARMVCARGFTDDAASGLAVAPAAPPTQLLIIRQPGKEL